VGGSFNKPEFPMTEFMLCAMLVGAPVPKEADERFEKSVNAAREKAIEFLRKNQNKDGNWEDVVPQFLAGMEGGVTALATLGLLEAGVPPDDAAITKAVDYLLKLAPSKTYIVSLQTQVLARVDAKKHAKHIQDNADWLLAKAIKTGDKLDGWSYPTNQIPDASNTHFAVMGLHAAAQAGAKIDAKVWDEVREHYINTRKNKGWTYYEKADPIASSSMTLCGVLGLSVAAKYDKNAKKPDPDVEKGMALALENWEPSRKSEAYRLFVMAELGRVLDVKDFKSGNNTRTWYREGAEKLIKAQNEDGALPVATTSIDGHAVISTAFGLYFLGPPKK
jgi:hypothetical protein